MCLSVLDRRLLDRTCFKTANYYETLWEEEWLENYWSQVLSDLNENSGCEGLEMQS